MWSLKGCNVMNSSCQELFLWVVVFKGGSGWWWDVVNVSRVGDVIVPKCRVTDFYLIVDFCFIMIVGLVVREFIPVDCSVSF